MDALQQTLDDYLAKALVQEVMCPLDEDDGVYSAFFPVAKKNSSKMRGCLNLKYTNELFASNTSKWRACKR